MSNWPEPFGQERVQPPTRRSFGAALSALIAAGLGGLTFVLVVLARPGWERLETALMLFPVWLVFGLAWSVAFVAVVVARGSRGARAWLWTPALVLLIATLTVGGAAASNYLRGSSAQLSVSATVVGTTLNVEGVTDLPTASRIWILAYHDSSFMIATEAEARVVDGEYSASLDLSRWPRGGVHVSAGFAMDESQPVDAVRRFGAEGERLFGPDVRQDSDGLVVLETSAVAELHDGLPPDHPSALREPAVVDGVVTDDEREWLNSASVTCLPVPGQGELHADRSFSHEAFFTCVVQPGRYLIEARASGFVPYSAEIELEAGRFEYLEIVMQRRP